MTVWYMDGRVRSNNAETVNVLAAVMLVLYRGAELSRPIDRPIDR